MTDNEALVWERGGTKVVWNGEKFLSPGALLWAAELPNEDGFAVVTLFDESTPVDIPNAFIYRGEVTFRSLRIEENGRLVRFLGCYAERDQIVFNAANETEYLVNPSTCEVQSTRYYR
jgi:hypothetical protein